MLGILLLEGPDWGVCVSLMGARVALWSSHMPKPLSHLTPTARVMQHTRVLLTSLLTGTHVPIAHYP